MIIYTTSATEKELLGILALQKANLAAGLTIDEIQSQGFVTVMHSYEQLKKINDFEKHIIAKDNDTVIAYLLAMTEQSRFEIPVLAPMFNLFAKISLAGKSVSSYNYIVVGQVCVDKQYRGTGILDNCYAAYKNNFKKNYDFAITEIVSTNLRSLNAHKRIGFTEIHRYIASDNTEWSIVAWDWKSKN